MTCQNEEYQQYGEDAKISRTTNQRAFASKDRGQSYKGKFSLKKV